MLIILFHLFTISFFGQKILKGKEIGIDLRNFNYNRNASFLVRKSTKDISIVKQKKYSFTLINISTYQTYNGINNPDIPNDYNSNTSNKYVSWGYMGKRKIFHIR